MAVLFMNKEPSAADRYMPLLKAALPDMEVRCWPEIGDPADIDYAVVGPPVPGVLGTLPNLRCILSTWAGVDKLLADPTFPRNIPLSRLVDPLLAVDMTHIAIHWVLHFHRDIPHYLALQDSGKWDPLVYPEASERRIGVMGQGMLGSAAARALADLGFAVAGWDAFPKAIAGVEAFTGADELVPFLNRTEILISLLPLTDETRGILNAETLAALPEGAYVISIARGAHIVDSDLIAALDSGHLAGAALDAFVEEPLPSTHPFWQHPKIAVTPHIASTTTPRTAVNEVVTDIRRLEAGEMPRHLVDMERGF